MISWTRFYVNEQPYHGNNSHEFGEQNFYWHYNLPHPTWVTFMIEFKKSSNWWRGIKNQYSTAEINGGKLDEAISIVKSCDHVALF